MADQSNKGKIRPIVFWPPFLLLFGVAVLSFINKEAFGKMMTGTNTWLMTHFGWLFNIGTMTMLFVCIAVFFSPLGKVKIGGANAKPMFTPWKWWAMTLCTGIAVGILFWGTAEPMFHLTSPPESLGIEPNSPQSAIFALSTLFLHWTFTPYAIYTVPTVIFAFAYYNMRKPFSLGSTLCPLAGDRFLGKWGGGIDAICLFALVTGMASSLGLGVMSMGGGINYLFGGKCGPFAWAIITAVVVGTFVISALTGITNGVKWLCDFNAKVFLGLLAFVFIVGPTFFSLGLGSEALGNYLGNFFQKGLFTGTAATDDWPSWWTVFYWANWLAWSPITSVFLGRISYGYSVRAVIAVNLITPAIFGGIWMTLFGGAAIHMEIVQHLGLAQVLNTQGVEGAAYFFFKQFPLAAITIPIFVFSMFLSYVTGADALTTSMGALSTTGISPDNPEPKMFQKILWGAVLGVVSWVMISFAGMDGFKMVSNIGGFPALFLELGMTGALILVALNPKKYDSFKEDYAADGSYISAGELSNTTSQAESIRSNPHNESMISN